MSIRNPPILSFDYPQLLENGEMMSREHILSRLARSHLVLHSMPPLGRGQGSPTDHHVNEVFPRVFTYRNPYWLPRVYGSPEMERLFAWFRSVHRAKIIRKLGGGRPINYIWHPYFADQIGRNRECLTVYHIYDDYRGYSDQHKYLAELERKLLREADIVFCISKSLIEARQREVGREIHFVPLGIDYDLYERARASGALCPDDLASISRPRISYIGRLNRKLDSDLLGELAACRPDWNFVLVGPLAEEGVERCKIDALKAHSNVYFLGRKRPDELPLYYINMDVNTMLYRSDNAGWYQHIHPLKMYEMMAAGRPIISTSLAEVGMYRSVIDVAMDRDSWIEAISHQLQSSDSSFRKEMIEIARQCSWDSRVDAIKGIINSRLELMANE